MNRKRQKRTFYPTISNIITFKHFLLATARMRVDTRTPESEPWLRSVYPNTDGTLNAVTASDNDPTIILH